MRVGNKVRQIGVLAAGSVLFAMGVNMFLLPGQIVVGGFTGIATVLHRLWGLPTGGVLVALNLPLLVWNGVQNGWRTTGRVLAAILVTSVATDVLLFPVSVTDTLLCALFGGICVGAGVGLLLRFGYTTGGTDLVAWLLAKRLPWSVGQTILGLDLLVIFGGSLLGGEPEAIFYAILCGFATARTLDTVTMGAERGKQALIFTDRPAELSAALMADLQRGVTILNGEGGYTGAPKKIVMCVVRTGQTARLKSTVARLDPQAFLLLSPVAEVKGRGFGSL